METLTNEKKNAWPKYLADLVLAYNSSTHEPTGYSPYFMMFGRQPRLPIDAAMGITLMMVLLYHNKRYFNQHTTSFKEDSRGWFKTKEIL